MLLLVQLSPEFSSQLLEEANATLALSLLLVAATKQAIFVWSTPGVVSVGQRGLDCCSCRYRMQGNCLVSNREGLGTNL